MKERLENMNQNNKVIKAGIWYTICNFFVKGLTFLLMPIFTRIMTSNDIGMFSNISSWFSILSIITTFELYSSVSIARFDYKKDLDSYISSTLFLGSIIVSLFYIIVLICHNFFENLFDIDFITLNIIFIYLLFYPSIQMFQIRNQIVYNYVPTVIVTIINAVLSSLGSILLTIMMTNALLGRIIGYYVPLIIVSICVYVYLLLKGKSISPRYWKYAITISFPLIWHLLAGNLLASADKVMITKLISADANGLYSIPYTISMIVSILWQSMNNAWSPWAYEQMDNKNYINLKEKSKPYFIFFFFIVLVFMLITPELLLIMGGRYYLQAKYVMPPVMIGYVFQFVYSLYVNIEFYHKKQFNIAIGTAIAALVNIILNYIFIPKLGYIVAAYTTLIGYILLYLIHFILVKKMGCIDWYDNDFFVKLLIKSLIMIIIMNILYVFNIIRYLIIIIGLISLTIFCIKYWNKLLYIIKNKEFSNCVEILKGEDI